jgi:hypothetical protein
VVWHPSDGDGATAICLLFACKFAISSPEFVSWSIVVGSVRLKQSCMYRCPRWGNNPPWSGKFSAPTAELLFSITVTTRGGRCKEWSWSHYGGVAAALRAAGPTGIRARSGRKPEVARGPLDHRSRTAVVRQEAEAGRTRSEHGDPVGWFS